MTENQPHPRRELPAWVFLLIILLCIGGGILFVTWYFRTPNPIREQVVLKSDEQLAAERAERRRDIAAQGNAPRGERGFQRGRMRQQPQTPSRIREVSREGEVRTYEVTEGQITMHVRDVPNGQPTFSFRLRSGLNLLSEQTRNLARIRWGILGDDNIARYLRVTDEQRNRLRQMELSNDLVVPEQHQDRMRTLWSEATPRGERVSPRIERQIIELLGTIATESEGPTRDRWTEQLIPVESILTPEQIAAYSQMGRRGAQRPPAPATQPNFRRRRRSLCWRATHAPGPMQRRWSTSWRRSHPRCLWCCSRRPANDSCRSDRTHRTKPAIRCCPRLRSRAESQWSTRPTCYPRCPTKRSDSSSIRLSQPTCRPRPNHCGCRSCSPTRCRRKRFATACSARKPRDRPRRMQTCRSIERRWHR